MSGSCEAKTDVSGMLALGQKLIDGTASGYKRAVPVLQAALELATGHEAQVVLSLLSSSYVDIGDTDKARGLRLRALELAEKSEDLGTQAELRLDIAQDAFCASEFESSLELYRSVTLLAGPPDSERRVLHPLLSEQSTRALLGLGHTLRQCGRPDDSLTSYRRALAQARLLPGSAAVRLGFEAELGEVRTLRARGLLADCLPALRACLTRLEQAQVQAQAQAQSQTGAAEAKVDTGSADSGASKAGDTKAPALTEVAERQEASGAGSTSFGASLGTALACLRIAAEGELARLFLAMADVAVTCGEPTSDNRDASTTQAPAQAQAEAQAALDRGRAVLHRLTLAHAQMPAGTWDASAIAEAEAELDFVEMLLMPDPVPGPVRAPVLGSEPAPQEPGS